ELPRSRVTQMFERMLRCCDELGKTLQPRLVLDCALIDVATVEPLGPLGDLIERLTEPEGRLAGRPARAGGGGGGAEDRPRPAAPPSGPSGPRPPATPVRTDAVGPPGGPGRGPGPSRSPDAPRDAARDVASDAAITGQGPGAMNR